MLRRIVIGLAVTLISSSASWAQPGGTATPPAPTVPPLGAPPVVAAPEPAPVAIPDPVEVEPVAVAATPVVDAVPTQPGSSLPIAEREFSAELGLAAGGRSTVGGARITGRFLYQLASQDWFEGSAIFNFGSSSAACFRDRSNERICEHGALDGSGVELSFGVRRYFDQGSPYIPFARAAIGIGIARFADDDITGIVVPLHAGGGLHVVVAPRVAIIGLADLTLGVGRFSSNLGIEPQLGFGISAGVEFSTR